MFFKEYTKITHSPYRLRFDMIVTGNRVSSPRCSSAECQTDIVEGEIRIPGAARKPERR